MFFVIVSLGYLRPFQGISPSSQSWRATGLPWGAFLHLDFTIYAVRCFMIFHVLHLKFEILLNLSNYSNVDDFRQRYFWTADHFRGTVGEHSQSIGANGTRSSLRRIEDVRIVLPGMPLHQDKGVLGNHWDFESRDSWMIRRSIYIYIYIIEWANALVPPTPFQKEVW